MGIDNQNASYAVITDLKHSFYFGRIFHKIRYFLRLFCVYINLFCALIIKNNNFKAKCTLKIKHLKRFRGYVTGHTSLLLSIFRGFDDLGISYTFNKITPYTKNIILSWCDREDLKIIEKLRENNLVKKVVTTPVACKYDYELQYVFPEYNCIDKVLVASEETKNKYFVSKVKSEYIDKVLPWPSGVEIPKNINSQSILADCICYYKRLPKSKELQGLLNKYNIKFIDIEYGQYRYEDWIDLLSKTNFVIFYQDYVETQGLAMAEAWAYNKPTFIKTNDKYGPDKTCPYLDNKVELFFLDLNELEKIMEIGRAHV